MIYRSVHLVALGRTGLENSQLGHVCERDRDGLENSQLDTVVKDHDFRLNGALCWCTSIDTPPRASPFAELFSGVGGFRFGG